MRFPVLPAILAACLALVPAAPAAAAAIPITGLWLTEDGGAFVAIEPCGGGLCGKVARIIKGPPGGGPAVDAQNPDPQRRGRPILGLAILSGFTDAGDDWRGRIYDPKTGKTYKSILRRNPDGTLKVQGCIAFFCKTQIWKAAH